MLPSKSPRADNGAGLTSALDTVITWTLSLFIGLALLGVALSAAAHVYALLGLAQPLGDAIWLLHGGFFLVWLPAVIAGRRLIKDYKQKDQRKALLRGCPAWLRWLTYALGAHALVNFLVFIVAMAAGPPVVGAPAPPLVIVGFSGHWMALYAAAAAILYSYLVVRRKDPARCCPAGHPVPPSALYCENCDVYVGEPAYAESVGAAADPLAPPE